VQRPDTRTRILIACAELFRRRGMTGTGLKQIATAAEAPFGSIYHFFPGGKAQLTEEVVRWSGGLYRDAGMALCAEHDDLPSASEGSFANAAEGLAATDYADACPIAAIALEVASTDEALRAATADVFADWIAAGAEALPDAGLDEDARRRVATAFVIALEGAFVLSRALRATEPLRVAAKFRQLVGVLAMRQNSLFQYINCVEDKHIMTLSTLAFNRVLHGQYTETLRLPQHAFKGGTTDTESI
jgi:AcrR family transcriptional regulator